jgi:aspartate/methionine/tyrosine aminotransferase
MLNHEIAHLGSYASKSIARRVESQAHVISLSIGEPAFGPPPSALQALTEAACSDLPLSSLKRYEESLGSPTLRQAIAGYYGRYTGLAVRPESDVLVTHGGAGALTAAILACSRPGDEILIGDPSYMLYERITVVLGRTPKRVPRRAEDGYRYDVDLVRSMVGPRTAALVLNSPENPTGYVCSADEMRGLARLCTEHDLTLIHDEVYDQFTFHGPHVPALGFEGFANAIQVNSTSKKFGVPGLRIGWLTSTPDRVAVAAKVQDYTSLAVNRFTERCAEVLLSCGDLSEWFAATRRDLEERVKLVVERLSAIPGFAFPAPVQGGMFAFPAVGGFAAALGTPPGSAGDAVSAWLLDVAHVAAVPGGIYGSQGADSVRLVLCGDRGELEQALDRIVAAARAEPALAAAPEAPALAAAR